MSKDVPDHFPGQHALHVNIDLDHMSKLAQTGVRRAALFMGLGLNAARRPEFKDYELNKLPKKFDQASMPIEFLPEGADEKTIGQYKVQFADWIVACGLREVLEHYGLMLDHVHKCALLVAHAKGFIGTVGDPVKLQRDFWRLGVAHKLRQLESRFGIKPDRPTDICALYRARNALSHGFGVVRDKDADTSGTLDLHWRAMELWAVGEVTRAESPLGNLIEKATTEPTKIEARFIERERSFRVGQRLKLTEQDLWEICYYFSSSCIPSALGSFRDFLRSHEIPIAGIEERGQGQEV